jgi:hypothetical protein
MILDDFGVEITNPGQLLSIHFVVLSPVRPVRIVVVEWHDDNSYGRLWNSPSVVTAHLGIFPSYLWLKICYSWS